MASIPSFNEFFHKNEPYQELISSLKHIKTEKPILHNDNFHPDFVYKVRLPYDELNALIAQQQLNFKIDVKNKDDLRHIFINLKPLFERDFQNLFRLNTLHIAQTINTVAISLIVNGEAIIHTPQDLHTFYTGLKQKDDQYSTDIIKYAQAYITELEKYFAKKI